MADQQLKEKLDALNKMLEKIKEEEKLLLEQMHD